MVYIMVNTVDSLSRWNITLNLHL